ncbi:unnamed protein product [Lupinus luteus]|uniref:Uncharacterized protein n=1 Tax=Lupinus luteus TaxID=3873 RepID=A0AAV1VQE9_LUPLU
MVNGLLVLNSLNDCIEKKMIDLLVIIPAHHLTSCSFFHEYVILFYDCFTLYNPLLIDHVSPHYGIARLPNLFIEGISFFRCYLHRIMLIGMIVYGVEKGNKCLHMFA